MPATALTYPAALLASWETTATPAQRTAQALHQPVVLACLAALHQRLLASPPRPADVDMDDARTVICAAQSLRAAQAQAAGPTRAADALRQLLAALPPIVAGQPARRALLYLSSAPGAPLEMNELSAITDTIQTALLHNEGEMIFGHCERPPATGDALQVWLLLGYQA